MEADSQFTIKPEKIQKRVKALYEIDSEMKHRFSYENESIKTLYSEFLIKPNSHIAHEILHTNYFDKSRRSDNQLDKLETSMEDFYSG